jgi:hypothetical protein
MLSMSSFTLFGSLALVLINGLLILSSGNSKITGPPFCALVLVPGTAPEYCKNNLLNHRNKYFLYIERLKKIKNSNDRDYHLMKLK